MTDTELLNEKPTGFAAVNSAAEKTARRSKLKDKLTKKMSFRDMFKRDAKDVKQAVDDSRKKRFPGVRDQIKQQDDPRAKYKEQHRKERMGDDYNKRSPTPEKLVPLQQADEMKVKQLAKRIDSKGAAQLGKLINDLATGNVQ